MYDNLIKKIRLLHNQEEGFIPLHAPVFFGNEKKYLIDTIDSTYVSSVGEYVNRFEEMMKEVTGAKYAIAIVNGTCALHLSLLLAGVERGDEVLTQALTFVATANAISHAGAIPYFIDVDSDSLGMSPSKLRVELSRIAEVRNNICYNKISGKRISACVPMHTFGLPLRIDEIVEICNEYFIPVVEDSTEAIGSYYRNKAAGTFGLLGTFSFNGNKTITSGAGGAIVTNCERLGKLAKHLSTTAKVPHPWLFEHDEIAFNYRMPNLNAALACAQLEKLDEIISNKRELALFYKDYIKSSYDKITFIDEISEARSNFWLCALLFEDRGRRDAFLEFSNAHGVMTRPAWTLMHKLPIYENCPKGNLSNSEWLEDRIVNIPSSFRKK